MAEFFDIDDPLMSKLAEKKVGDDFPGLERVIPRWDSDRFYEINSTNDHASPFQDMIDFALDETLPGQVYVEYYDPTVGITLTGRVVQYRRIFFYFTDPNSAFAFRMRFG